MLRQTTLEAECAQTVIQLGVPRSGSLLQTVQGLVQAQDKMLLAGDDKFRWLLLIDFFLELAVQERRFDVHVMNGPARVRRECQQHPY